MSRIGKKPIEILDKVKVSVENNQVLVEGPKGKLKKPLVQGVSIEIKDKKIFVRSSEEGRQGSAKSGLVRALIANMVKGVHQGFERGLEISGVGYRAEKTGNVLVLHLGYSHKIEFPIPQNIDITVEKNVNLVVRGPDRELVGQVAAKIRSFRRADPYKAKGIIYQGEKIIRKAGKKAIS